MRKAVTLFDKFAKELREMKEMKEDKTTVFDLESWNYIACKLQSWGPTADDDSTADSSMPKARMEYKYIHGYKTLFGTKLNSLDHVEVCTILN